MHDYPVSVDWTGGREGSGSAKPAHSGSTFQLAVGKEFQGTGEGTNPEELLTSAIGSCYTITFGIIAANRKIPVKSIHVDVVGQVEQNGVSLVYKAITLRPQIVLESSATDEQVALATDMAHKADGYCLVTNAVRGKVEIACEPTVTKG
jgi:peroxiredoxin-like protein